LGFGALQVMLAELAVANASTWRSRWYYVMLNKKSGMLYVGQSFNLESRSYCGSGQYWVAHCKKHGGYGRKNIEVVQKFWAETKSFAQCWLNEFENVNPSYFERSNTKWANRARETTEDSAFCGITNENRVEYARAGGMAAAKIPGHMANMASIQGKVNADSGHMGRIQKIGCSLGGKVTGPILGKKMADSGHLAKIAKAGGATVSKQRHATKDIDTGKSLFAVQLGQASGVTRWLMKKFCQEFGIRNPGTNYTNIDKAAFKHWKSQNVG